MIDATPSSLPPNDAPAPETPPTDLPTQLSGDQDLEHRYYQYLRHQQYSSTDALVRMLRWYLPYFAGFSRVLDIGCGHGEFLQLLQEAGHEAVGIDIDPAMVNTCQALGLTAYAGDAISWLATQPNQFDAIFSSNVIEHMDAPSVQRLIQQAHGALRPGGLLLIGTPNPESLIVQFHEFWRDPTHVRLYGRQLIEFFLADAGFHNIHNGNNAEAAWDGVDHLFAPITASATQTNAQPLLATIPPVAPLPALHPLPQPPPADAPLRRRLAFRLLNLVYQKFLEPYIALIRLDQERQQQQNQALHALVHQLHESNILLQGTLRTTVDQVEARLQQFGHGFRFMHPPRELFVYGYKAPADDRTTAEPTAKAQPLPTAPDEPLAAPTAGKPQE
jgi:SAM-dependent methyltransferase